MSFSISQFKSRVASEGFLRSSHYDVMINAPVGGFDNIRLRTETASLPGSAHLNVDVYRPYNTGVVYTIPYSYNPTPVACVHTVDSNSDLIKAFWNWSNLITDLEGTEYQHAANYHDNYVGTMTIMVRGPDGSTKSTYTLNEVFPESIDQVQMSWGSEDIVRLNVSYRYSSYNVS